MTEACRHTGQACSLSSVLAPMTTKTSAAATMMMTTKTTGLRFSASAARLLSKKAAYIRPPFTLSGSELVRPTREQSIAAQLTLLRRTSPVMSRATGRPSWLALPSTSPAPLPRAFRPRHIRLCAAAAAAATTRRSLCGRPSNNDARSELGEGRRREGKAHREGAKPPPAPPPTPGPICMAARGPVSRVESR